MHKYIESIEFLPPDWPDYTSFQPVCRYDWFCSIRFPLYMNSENLGVWRKIRPSQIYQDAKKYPTKLQLRRFVVSNSTSVLFKEGICIQSCLKLEIVGDCWDTTYAFLLVGSKMYSATSNLSHRLRNSSIPEFSIFPIDSTVLYKQQ